MIMFVMHQWSVTPVTEKVRVRPPSPVVCCIISNIQFNVHSAVGWTRQRTERRVILIQHNRPKGQYERIRSFNQMLLDAPQKPPTSRHAYIQQFAFQGRNECDMVRGLGLAKLYIFQKEFAFNYKFIATLASCALCGLICWSRGALPMESCYKSKLNMGIRKIGFLFMMT